MLLLKFKLVMKQPKKFITHSAASPSIRQRDNTETAKRKEGQETEKPRDKDRRPTVLTHFPDGPGGGYEGLWNKQSQTEIQGPDTDNYANSIICTHLAH